MKKPVKTDKWVETVVKVILMDEATPPSNLERENTIDVKRHRVFSTSADIQPRETIRRTLTSTDEETPKRNARESVGREISS